LRFISPKDSRLVGLIDDASQEAFFWNSGWFTAALQFLVGLKPGEAVVDIGCGAGRLAYGLHGWFSGTYVGVDIVPDLVRFCRRKYPNFQFHLLTTHNAVYNPKGSSDPAAVQVPAPDGAFDVAVLLSVYTHLLPDTMAAVTREVGRLLKPGGRCLASFFILNGQTASATAAFSHVVSPECRAEDARRPEDALAYTAAFVRSTFASAGMRSTAEHRGTWTGNDGLSYQDLWLFRKD
jgi:SAM-dependent methyltransferase